MGTIGPDADLSGTASIDIAATVTGTGGATAIGGMPTVGVVQVSLDNGYPTDTINATFGVTSSITLNGSGGGSITFDIIQHDQPSMQILAKGGGIIVSVTGRANLSAGQIAGTYTGTLVLTVSNVDEPLEFDVSIVSVTMVVLQPISISTLDELSFGGFTPSGAEGTVIISRQSVRTATGGVTLIPSKPGLRGSVMITGEPNVLFSYTGPADNSVVLSNGTGGTMTIQTFDLNLSTTLNGSGNRLRVTGGTLLVGANQEAGLYTGTYTLNAIYD